MHFIQAIVTTSIGIVAFILFKENPNLPPSRSAIVPRTSFCLTLKKLITYRDFIFLAIFIAITDSIYVAYRLIMRDAFTAYGITSYPRFSAGYAHVIV